MKKYRLLWLCAALIVLAACSSEKRLLTTDHTPTPDNAVPDEDTAVVDELAGEDDALLGDQTLTDDIASDDIVADEDGLLTDDDVLTELTCEEMVNCGNSCSGDRDCIDACVAMGSTAAQEQYSALETCATINCTTECDPDAGTVEQCETCAAANCPAEVNACYGIPDALSCSEIITCQNNCAADQSCRNACVTAGSTEGQAEYNAVLTCAAAQCATECGSGMTQECQTCITTDCAAEVNACLTD
ncbi:MAG TPA: hypothetical protein PLV42_04915 [bacterium]|nr:hypothetical protein [bacterium]